MGHLPGAEGAAQPTPQAAVRQLTVCLAFLSPSPLQRVPLPSVERWESLPVLASKPGPQHPVPWSLWAAMGLQTPRARGLRFKVAGMLRDRAGCSRGPHGPERQPSPSPDPQSQQASYRDPQLEGCGDGGAADVAGSSDGLHVGEGQACTEGGGLGERFRALVWAAGHTSVTVGMPDPLAWGWQVQPREGVGDSGAEPRIFE